MIIFTKDNIEISVFVLLLELCIVLSSSYTVICIFNRPMNPLIVDYCLQVMEINDKDADIVSSTYGLISSLGMAITFQMQLSIIVILFSFQLL
jgi:hypothetical protein